MFLKRQKVLKLWEINQQQKKAMQMILCFIVYQKELRFCFPR